MEKEKRNSLPCGYFTVIITAYNMETYICDCIASVRAQTFPDFECIVVNDGSEDRTAKVIADSIRTDPRFRLVTIPHGGPQCAKNAGLERAHGDYVIFVDGDDTLAPECLAECREKTEGADLLIFGIEYQRYADEKLISKQPVSLSAMEFASGSELADWYMEHQRLLLYSNANKFYRREALKNGGIRFRDDLSFGEDRVFNFDFLRVCRRIRVLSGVYYRYREIRSASLTRTFRRHHIDTLLELHEQKIACMCELSQKQSEQAKEKYARDDYNGCFDTAFEILKSRKEELTEEVYAEEKAYLESRFVPPVQKPPFRFYLDHAWMSKEKRAADFLRQIRVFKESDAMQSLLSILDGAAQKTEYIRGRAECGDDFSFLCQFGTRRGERQQSRNSAAALRIEDLLRDQREPLYRAFFDLGLIGNNKPYFDRYDCILILGGANDANRSRTKKAKEVADALIARGKRPTLIAGVGTNRKLSEPERQATDRYADGAEYEFDVLSKCLENELLASGEGTVLWEARDEDPTFASKVVEYRGKYDGCTVRVYCAPKRDLNVPRADTADCLEFFLAHSDLPEGASVLLVTNNIYCGSSFRAGIGIGHGIDLDIVGNRPDGSLIPADRMSIAQHLDELIKTYTQLNEFEADYR